MKVYYLTLGISLLFVLSTAAANLDDWQQYLGDDALTAGRLPADEDGLEGLVRHCVDVVGAYLAREPGDAVAPDDVRDALRFLAFYPHPAAAEVSACLLEATSFPLVTGPVSETRYCRATDAIQYATTSHAAAISILLALDDERAAPAVIADVDVSIDKLWSAVQTLALVPGEYSRAFLSRVAADTALGDKLFAALDDITASDSHREEQRQKCAANAVSLRTSAQRAIHRSDLARDGLSCPFDLPHLLLDRLANQGVAVSGEVANEHFELLTAEYPFLTTDAVWHVFMRLTADTYDSLEQLTLRDELAAFTGDLARAAANQATALPASRRTDAWHNAAVAMVPARLLGVENLPTLPDSFTRQVDDELGLVREAGGPATSPLSGRMEDYVAYRPRGRHSDPGTDQDWFRAMTWCGRVTWHLDDLEELARAQLLGDLLAADASLMARWRRIDAALTLFFGPADDPTPADLVATFEGGECNAAALATLPPPSVNTDPFVVTRGQARGVRLFGQRATPDARLLQQHLDQGDWPVSGLDVMAELLGSSRAAAIRASGRASNGRPPAPAARGSARPDSSSLISRSLTLLSGLYTTPPGAPAALMSEAWQDKQLNTTLAAWAELRHVNHVFLKEAYTVAGLSRVTSDLHGYVEPYPEFYAGLRDLVDEIVARCGAVGLWDSLDRLPAPETDEEWNAAHPYPDTKALAAAGVSPAEIDLRISEYVADIWMWSEMCKQHRMKPSPARWREFSDLLVTLEDLARRELAGRPQTPADCALLRSLGRRLQRLSLNENNYQAADRPMSCIVDVAVAAQECLEVGVIRPRAIYVVVDVGGRRQVCRGGISTYVEFVWPATDRLDDERWRELGTQSFQMPWILTQPTFALTTR